MKMTEYLAVINRASLEDATPEEKARARSLKQAAGTNQLKLERE